jgi:protoporphyrinogen IX oxidase
MKFRKMFFYIKALHVIFVVTWFAGLFYIVRLFIYHAEAETKREPERSILQSQYKIMEKRLWYGITWPSMILTLSFGTWLAILYGTLSNWLMIKLCLVVGLVIYHIYCGLIFYNLQKDLKKYNSNKLRILNEVATLFLVSIVFVVELKNSLNAFWGIASFIAFSMILFAAIKIYKKIREKSN